MPKALTLESVESKVQSLRGQRVILSTDLAPLYGVRPKVLVQAVKRHIRRFPPDFMFRLTRPEFQNLKSQSVTSSWGGLRAMPYAFTERGVAMLSSVLNSPRAIAVNIAIMRAFAELRRLSTENIGLARRLDILESRYDFRFKQVFIAIRKILSTPKRPKRRIGFTGP